mgnify:CR=1 FL=1
MDIKESREVWWASTMQYEIELNGKEYSIRIAEDSNQVQLFWLSENGWSELYEGEANGDVNIENLNEIYKAWEEGELVE